ncbi:MAG: DUF3795 domain-containing protein [Patescibacteria group bacterium]
MKSNLIAPCGMNCGICLGYLREKNKCLGCRGINKNKLDSCRKCSIKNCQILKKNKMFFCSDKCEKFPCARLKNLDKRYRTKYKMSMLENLEFIKNNGIRMFVKKEKSKWACKKCDGTICVHRGFCLNCGNKN